MEVHEKLGEIIDLVETARSMPMSASCIVHRGQMLDLLDEVRALLPGELQHADAVLADRAGLIGDAQEQADELLVTARQEQERLVSEHEVLVAAQWEAAKIREEAEAEAERMRRETDDYVDAKLAGLEIALTKTLGVVQHGRDRISERRTAAEVEPEPLPSVLTEDPDN